MPPPPSEEQRPNLNADTDCHTDTQQDDQQLALFFFIHRFLMVHSMYSPPYIGLELLRLPTQTPVPDLAFGLYFITKSSRVSFSVSIWDFI